jgi:exodeoxyribonuclease VII small subunit
MNPESGEQKEISFEQGLARLKEIVAALEDGNLPLQQGVAMYKEGAALIKSCRTRLENAKHEVLILQDGQWREFPPLNEEDHDSVDS